MDAQTLHTPPSALNPSGLGLEYHNGGLLSLLLLHPLALRFMPPPRLYSCGHPLFTPQVVAGFEGCCIRSLMLDLTRAAALKSFILFSSTVNNKTMKF